MDIVKFLVENGADIWIKDMVGTHEYGSVVRVFNDFSSTFCIEKRIIRFEFASSFSGFK